MLIWFQGNMASPRLSYRLKPGDVSSSWTESLIHRESRWIQWWFCFNPSDNWWKPKKKKSSSNPSSKFKKDPFDICTFDIPICDLKEPREWPILNYRFHARASTHFINPSPFFQVLLVWWRMERVLSNYVDKRSDYRFDQSWSLKTNCRFLGGRSA